MDWQEVNCVVDALKLLVERYGEIVRNSAIDEDDRSDTTNDLAYAEILLHKYEDMRSKIASS